VALWHAAAINISGARRSANACLPPLRSAFSRAFQHVIDLLFYLFSSLLARNVKRFTAATRRLREGVGRRRRAGAWWRTKPGRISWHRRWATRKHIYLAKTLSRRHLLRIWRLFSATAPLVTSLFARRCAILYAPAAKISISPALAPYRGSEISTSALHIIAVTRCCHSTSAPLCGAAPARQQASGNAPLAYQQLYAIAAIKARSTFATLAISSAALKTHNTAWRREIKWRAGGTLHVLLYCRRRN